MVKDLKTSIYWTSICLVFSQFHIGSVHSFSDGAPSSSCTSWKPSWCGGVNLARDGSAEMKPPFRVIVSTDKIANHNTNPETVRVTIWSKYDDMPFKGWILRARIAEETESEGATPIGSWAFSPLSKQLNCYRGLNNAVTHSDATQKKEVTIEWTPPLEFAGKIQFAATVYQTAGVYWSNVHSAIVTVS